MISIEAIESFIRYRSFCSFGALFDHIGIWRVKIEVSSYYIVDETLKNERFDIEVK